MVNKSQDKTKPSWKKLWEPQKGRIRPCIRSEWVDIAKGERRRTEERTPTANCVCFSLSLTPVQNKTHDAAQVWDHNCGRLLSANVDLQLNQTGASSSVQLSFTHWHVLKKAFAQ